MRYLPVALVVIAVTCFTARAASPVPPKCDATLALRNLLHVSLVLDLIDTRAAAREAHALLDRHFDLLLRQNIPMSTAAVLAAELAGHAHGPGGLPTTRLQLVRSLARAATASRMESTLAAMLRELQRSPSSDKRHLLMMILLLIEQCGSDLSPEGAEPSPAETLDEEALADFERAIHATEETTIDVYERAFARAFGARHRSAEAFRENARRGILPVSAAIRGAWQGLPRPR